MRKRCWLGGNVCYPPLPTELPGSRRNIFGGNHGCDWMVTPPGHIHPDENANADVAECWPVTTTVMNSGSSAYIHTLSLLYYH